MGHSKLIIIAFSLSESNNEIENEWKNIDYDTNAHSNDTNPPENIVAGGIKFRLAHFGLCKPWIDPIRNNKSSVEKHPIPTILIVRLEIVEPCNDECCDEK